MATKFIESGGDATQGLEFYSSTTGTVAVANDKMHTGPYTIKCSTGAGSALASCDRTGVIADTGRRVSMRFLFDSTPTAATGTFSVMSAGAAQVMNIVLNTSLQMEIRPAGVSPFITSSTVLSANTWYRLVMSYYITNTTTWACKLYIYNDSGTLLETLTANTGTLTATGAVNLSMRIGAGAGANKNHWYDDIYVDDGASSASQPDFSQNQISVTNKRPNADGTTVGFTTQIGSGGSGYGTGHSPQVNEQPLSVTNGWSMVGAGSAVTEEYSVEGTSTGDVDISKATLIDYGGWLYQKAIVSETATMITGGASSTYATGTANSLITSFASSTTYPSGGTDIGMTTSTDLTTVSLYECGLQFAYKPATSVSAIATLLYMGAG